MIKLTCLRNSVWDSVDYSVYKYIFNSVWCPVYNSIWGKVGEPVRSYARNSVWNFVRVQVKNSGKND